MDPADMGGPDQKPMINTRIQAVLTARKHAQWNKPIISWPSVVDRAQIPCRIAYTRAQSWSLANGSA